MVQAVDYTKFLQLHEAQLLTNNIPQHFWQTLYVKLKNQVFDSHNTFSLLKIDYEDEIPSDEDPLWVVQIVDEKGIKKDDREHIYLVDHAWTFRVNDTRETLLENECLLNRLCNIMGVSDEETDSELSRVDKICKLMWKYSQTYSVNTGNLEDRLPVWYIMDELGCAIQHSDDPNFRAVPFVYIPEQITYTIIFPIKDLDFGEMITRDFVESVANAMERKSQLLPWFKTDFSDFDYSQREPDEQYFLTGHIEESLPISIDLQIKIPGKIRVYSEYNFINEFLTDPRFEITNDANNAHILWYTKHFKSFLEFSKNPNRFINQFPFENVLTIKDLLAIVCRRQNYKCDCVTLETSPAWLPTTYNLKTELTQFVSFFQNREKQNLDNHWICKPWNLARSLDTFITDNLDFIVKLSSTGPKIAQKYIHDPVLFYRPECGKVKFDVRYVILLKSVAPLIGYVYKNFFLRFSNKPFELTDFHDYEKHFTVMNYDENTKLHHLPCADFLKQWDQQYPNFSWKEIEKHICEMLKGMLEGATCMGPPKGIAPSPQSRAVYAVDIILSWDLNRERILPKLLEVNFTPDCKRACDYYPNFYNDIFGCLFTDDENINSFISL